MLRKKSVKTIMMPKKGIKELSIGGANEIKHDGWLATKQDKSIRPRGPWNFNKEKLMEKEKL